MIVSIDKLRENITTDKADEELGDRLLALESSIRKTTNNNFINRKIRFASNTDEIKTAFAPYLKEGDTLQVFGSLLNDGLYTIKSINGEILTLNEQIFNEPNVLFIKVEYPADVQRGVINILRWQLKNEDKNFNPDAEKEVQSETISRHSVTYAKDNTEEDLDEEIGVPKKYTSFLKKYMKAQF